MYTYRQIFLQALKTAWRHPSLWFFAILLALSGGGSMLELFIGSFGLGNKNLLFAFWQGLYEGGLFTVSGVSGIIKLIGTNPISLFLILLLILFFLALTVVVIWLGVISQAALIKQSIAVTKKEKSQWTDAFTFGINKFWPVLGISLFMRLIVWVITAVVGLFTLVQFPGFTFVYILSFDILIAVSIILSFVGSYGLCGLVLKDLSIKDALLQSIALLRKNWLLTLEIGILLFAISLLANSLLSWVLFWFFLVASRMFAGFLFGMVIIDLIIITVFLALQILLITFHWTTWSLVYELISSGKNLLHSFLNDRLKKLFH